MTAANILQSAQNIADTNCQSEPKPNANPAVWSLVMRDMTERDIFGAEKYGVRLQPGNGRDFLVDAYQEALDLVAYLRGAIYERDQLATADKFAAMQSELPASFGQQNMIDPADVELYEEPAAAIDDESPRSDAIGQNGNDGEVYVHYGMDGNHP